MSRKFSTTVHRELYHNAWTCDCCGSSWEATTDDMNPHMPYLRNFQIATDANKPLKSFDFCIDCLALALTNGKGLRWLATGQDRPKFTVARKRWYPKLIQEQAERAPFNRQVIREDSTHAD